MTTCPMPSLQGDEHMDPKEAAAVASVIDGSDGMGR